MEKLLNELAAVTQKLLAYLKSKMTPLQQLALIAQSKLGTDFTDDKKLADEVSCAFAVTSILHEQDPRIPIMTGTATLFDLLIQSKLFRRVYEPQAGTITICVTGQGKNPLVPNGHTGIYLSEDKIASNDSSSGLWTLNYTRTSWRSRYYWRGGYPIYLFNKIV